MTWDRQGSLASVCACEDEREDSRRGRGPLISAISVDWIQTAGLALAR